MNAELPTSSWVPWSLFIVGLLSLLCYGVVQSEGLEPDLFSTGREDLVIEPPTRSFTISADPAVAVLQLEASGGLSNETTAYILYGDGRLVRTHTWAPGQTTSKELQLSYGGAMDLVGLVVEGGLMEWDGERLKQQLIDSLGRVPSWTDSRRLEVRIALESYSGSPEGEDLPMTKTIATRSVGLLRREAPHIREIVAIDELARILSLYFRPPEESE